MTILKSYFIPILLLTMLSECKSFHRNDFEFKKQTLIKAGFDIESWKKDTLGLNSRIKATNAKILINQPLFFKCNKNEIKELLGNPYLENDNSTKYYYILDGELMYANLKFKGVLLTSSNAYLVVVFDNKDKIINAFTEFP